jgi:hypothetical protein
MGSTGSDHLHAFESQRNAGTVRQTGFEGCKKLLVNG